MTNAGAADWLRGIVTPQVIGGSAAGAAVSLLANVAPSAECLLVFAENGVAIQITSVIGATTFGKYPFVPYGGIVGQSAAMWVVPVSNPTDQQVNINLAAAPGVTWLAINDQGIRITADAVLASLAQFNGIAAAGIGILAMGRDTANNAHALEVDTSGRLAVGDPNVPNGVIPQVPTISVNFFYTNPTSTLLAAPPSGAYYLFGVDDYLSGAAGETAQLTGNGVIFHSFTSVATDASQFSDLNRIRITTAVMATCTANNGVAGTLRYALGP